MDDHSKTHRYQTFAGQYSELGFTDTYFLGLRDIPALLEKYSVTAGKALDHGCGGGRATAGQTKTPQTRWKFV